MAHAIDRLGRCLMKPIIVSLIVVLVPIVACATPTALQPVPTRWKVPAFELLDITGTFHTLTDYRDKILVINFWAMWCAPCLQEMPSLQRAWSQLQRDNIQVLSINIGDSEEDLSSFVKVFQVDFPLLMDTAMALTRTWSVTALPTTFVVDARGYVVYIVIGERQWDNPKILEQIRRLKDSEERNSSATRP